MKQDTQMDITSDKINGYELSRNFWDYSFENPDIVKPYHVAIYFFAVEHCNRLGWKKKFGFPTSMVLEAIGLKSYSSYKKYFDELVSWGFFKVHEYSKNQYSSNIIELSFNAKAQDKALDKALIKHTTKQSESTVQSTDSINKQETIKPITKEQETNALHHYFDDESLNTVFNQWLKMLDERQKPMTQSTIEALQMKMNRQSVEYSINQVEQSLHNGWLTLRSVELKEEKEHDFKNFDNVEYP